MKRRQFITCFGATLAANTLTWSRAGLAQQSANKRFYLLDFKSGEVTAYYAAHGRSNGPNVKAVKFKGFRRDLDMTPLGPLKTAHSEVMAHYKTIVDRYDGTVYRNMIVAVLQ